MNKFIYLVFIIIFLSNCSFDNKTSIWTGSNKVVKKKNNIAENIEFIFKEKDNTIIEKELSSNQILKIDNPKSISEWSQSYQNKFNNLGNVSFFNEGKFKRFSKISSAEVNRNILVYKNNLFFSDNKGNIGIFSIDQNQLIFKFNFYKKKMKKTKKYIKLILKDNSIIAADNFGYIYSIDYQKKKLNWAKNFLVPFRSNLKIIGNTLFLSDEKNKIILINIENGTKIDEFYTQPSKTVSKFENNFAIDNYNNLLFLSTSGSLYSLNLINQKTINWIQNFKSENEIIFTGNPIIISDDNIIISTSSNISMVNKNGTRIWDLNIKSNIPPIISGNILFVVNEDNQLLLIDKGTGQVIYSKSLFLLIKKDFKKSFQKKIRKIDYVFLVNNKLLLISNNSYFIEFTIDNVININSIKKNSFNISSDIIFLKNEMIFVDGSKRIYKVN